MEKERNLKFIKGKNKIETKDEDLNKFYRPGSDLLSRVLRQSTISAEAFHDRVRNGIGCSHFAIITRSAKGIKLRSWILMNINNGNDQAYRTISISKLHMLPYFHT